MISRNSARPAAVRLLRPRLPQQLGKGGMRQPAICTLEDHPLPAGWPVLAAGLTKMPALTKA